MSKQCKKCGSSVPNEARFCQNCGGSDFIANNFPANETDFESTTLLNENFENTTVLNDNFEKTQYNPQPPVNQNWQPTEQNWQAPANQGYQQQPPVNQNWQQPANQNWQQPVNTNPQPPMNQGWQQPMPQNKPKKKNTGLIIGIIAGVVVLLAIIGAVAEKAFQSQDYGNDYDYSYNDDYSSDSDYDFSLNSSEESSSYVEEKVDYTKGTFDGAVYTNDWANIKLNLPEGFSNADAATYAGSENASTDCGAYFIADDTLSAIYICFEKLPTFPVYDEEEYLDAVMNTLSSVTEITYQTNNSYSTSMIAGEFYKKASCTFQNAYGTFYHNFYVRKIDNYVVVISTMGVSDSAADTLANTVVKAK